MRLFRLSEKDERAFEGVILRDFIEKNRSLRMNSQKLPVDPHFAEVPRPPKPSSQFLDVGLVFHSD